MIFTRNHIAPRFGAAGRDWLVQARIIEQAWTRHRGRRITKLSRALSGHIERAKALVPLVTPLHQGAALTACFGPDVGRLIQRQLAASVIGSYARPALASIRRRRDTLSLKVVTQDGNEIFFKCKMTTALGKLMNAFCNRQGVNIHSVRFLFDGQRINPNQTPRDLEMEDGDVIDVMVEQQGD